MKLFICEKPSQAKDIAQVLGASTRTEHCFEGAGVSVTWCVGHLLSLAPPEHYCEQLKPWRMAVLPIVPTAWTVMPQEKTKKQLTGIGKLLKKATAVVIATDADREGDVIGREVLDYFNYKGPLERLWLSALDEASIKKALLSIRPGDSTYALYQAGLGRQRADWLVGMNLTMAVSCLFGVRGQGVLSVGRVQTPSLKLIVDRDLSIEQFKPHPYFVLKAQFQTAEQDAFWSTWVIPEDLSDIDGRCVNKAVVDEMATAIANQTARVITFSDARKKTSAPLCLSLSTLQKLASSQFGLTAKQTLDVAQTLYEKHKATSYPRTDCGYLPESQFSDAKNVFHALAHIDDSIKPLLDKCNLQFKSSVWNDKKITAHHGIIPTSHARVDMQSMTQPECQIYGLIRAYFIAQFLGDYVYSQRQAEIGVCEQVFKTGSNTPITAGWREAISGLEDVQKDEEDDKSPDQGLIPLLAENESLLTHATHVTPCKTKPAARFTEGTLITTMKSIAKYVDDARLKKILKDTAGIGTEATRANIIETLVSRDYIKRQGKQLISTTKGRQFIEQLPASITSPATTALWEQTLDSIANGESTLSDFLDDQRDTLDGMLMQLEQRWKSRSVA